MNKLVISAIASAFVAVVGIATTLTSPTAQAAAPACTITANGKSNLQTTVGSAYTVANNIATVHFDVTGPDNCEQLVTMVSWQAPSLSGSPFDQQKIYKISRTTVKPGKNQTLSIETPTCYFQIDALRGESPYGSDYSKGYGDRQIASIHGGTKSCENVKVCNPTTGQIITVSKTDEDKYKPAGDVACKPDVMVCNPVTGQTISVKAAEASKYKPLNDKACTDIKVCDLTSKAIVTIKESTYDSAKYSKNLADRACQPTITTKINVCVVATKAIAEIDDNKFDANTQTKDLDECQPTLISEETPEVLPSTGPSEALSAVLGMSSLAGSATAYLRSRRALR